jgi:hypothetical protein
VQDVKLTGISLDNAKLAIKMARVKPKRVMTDKQREHAVHALAKSRSDHSKFPGQSNRSLNNAPDEAKG